VSAKNDAAFLRMFLIILGALVAFTVIIMIAASQITGSVEEARGEDPRIRAKVAERIKPVGSVKVATVEAAPETPKSGAEIVASACNSCHGAGVLGAPKTGDQAAWQARMAAGGLDGLTASAISGKGAMPPKGGAMVSDAEIRAAVEHLLTESGVDLAGGAPAATAEQPAAEAPVAPVEAAKEMAASAADAAASMAAAVMPGATTEAPAAPVPVAEEAPAETGADLAQGKSVYDAACFVCHGTGAAGAPKLGDKAAWEARIAQGMDTLNLHAINGKGAMPPKGGRMDLSDDDIKAAVAYIVSESR
jgi:cytochrome c5